MPKEWSIKQYQIIVIIAKCKVMVILCVEFFILNSKQIIGKSVDKKMKESTPKKKITGEIGDKWQFWLLIRAF